MHSVHNSAYINGERLEGRVDRNWMIIVCSRLHVRKYIAKALRSKIDMSVDASGVESIFFSFCDLKNGLNLFTIFFCYDSKSGDVFEW